MNFDIVSLADEEEEIEEESGKTDVLIQILAWVFCMLLGVYLFVISARSFKLDVPFFPTLGLVVSARLLFIGIFKD